MALRAEDLEAITAAVRGSGTPQTVTIRPNIGGQPGAQPGVAAPAGPSPYGDIRAPKGFGGRLAERAGIPTTTAGWAANPLGGALGLAFSPFALRGELADTAGDALGIRRPVGGIVTPGGSPAFSLGNMAEVAPPWRTGIGDLLRGVRGAVGGARGLSRDVAAGIAEAQGAGAVARPRGPLALPQEAGPSVFGSGFPMGGRVTPGFAMPERGVQGPLTVQPPMPRPGPTPGPRPVPMPDPVRPPIATEPAERRAPWEGAAAGRPPAGVVGPEPPARLEDFNAYLQANRGRLQGPDTARFVQLSNAYNRTPEGPERDAVMQQIFELMRDAAVGGRMAAGL
jgi:hypothetical protein